MTFEELGASLSESAGIPKSQASELVHALLGQIGAALANGERVALTGFGSFSVVVRAARIGRNPQTGAPMNIPAKNVVKFSPAAALEKSVNGR